MAEYTEPFTPMKRDRAICWHGKISCAPHYDGTCKFLDHLPGVSAADEAKEDLVEKYP